MKKWLILAAGAVLVAAGATFLLQMPPEPRIDKVVLVTIDTLRARQLGCYGYHHPTSPNIDAWAKTAVLFENNVVQAPWTVPSLGSLFTGHYPVEAGVYTNRGGISPELMSLPQLFKQHQFRTASFNTHALLVNKSGGFRRGFDDVFPDTITPARFNEHKIPWSNTEPYLMQWLDEHARERFFIWIHSMDPHGPPTVGNPYLGRHGWPGYDAEVRWVDEAFGRILSKLEEVGIREEVLLVFAADHGEAFGEHGIAGHQDVMYDEVLQAPLIIQYPGMGRTARISAPVELLDVFPTIVELAGLTPPPGTRGESLVPLIEGRRQERRRSHLFSARYHFPDGHHQLAARDRDWKLLIRVPDQNEGRPGNPTVRDRRQPIWHLDGIVDRAELYHLTTDRLEKKNVAAERPEQVRALRGALADWQAELGLVSRRPAPELDQRSQEALRALGYE
jgi:arylsulfatase A-like enzyme